MSATDKPGWRLEDLDGKYSLDFDSMSCTVRSESFASSVGTGRDSDTTAAEEWFVDARNLLRAGWTEAEYVQHGLAVFDIRRTDDGSWEARPKERYWRRSIERVKRALEGSLAHDSDRDDYKKLTGEDYDTARDRGIDILQRLSSAPWQSMGNVAPRVEEKYQAYLKAKS